MGLRADITKLKKEVKRMAGSEVFDLLARAVDGDESAAHKLLTRREGDGRTDNLDQLLSRHRERAASGRWRIILNAFAAPSEARPQLDRRCW